MDVLKVNKKKIAGGAIISIYQPYRDTGAFFKKKMVPITFCRSQSLFASVGFDTDLGA